MDPNTNEEDEYEYPSLAVEGAYVSDDGKYTCESCEKTLKPTYETTIVNGWKRSIFECPECGEEYPCY